MAKADLKGHLLSKPILILSAFFIYKNMEEEIEIWKEIPGYEGLYEVSSFGAVRSLTRIKHMHTYVGRQIKPFLHNRYYQYVLSMGPITHTKKAHVLVAMAFLGHKPNKNVMVVDHIDNDPLNNKLSNLQVISNRLNSSKDRKNKSSKYVGVSWHKGKKKWCARISYNKSLRHLGEYDIEENARNAYQSALKEIESGLAPTVYNSITNGKPNKHILHTSKNRFTVIFSENGVKKRVGYFSNIEDAIICRDEYIKSRSDFILIK